MNNLRTSRDLNWRLSAIFIGNEDEVTLKFSILRCAIFNSYIKHGFVYKLIWRDFLLTFIQNGDV